MDAIGVPDSINEERAEVLNVPADQVEVEARVALTGGQNCGAFGGNIA